MPNFEQYGPNGAATSWIDVVKTIDGNNTANIKLPIFRFTGTLHIVKLFAVVETTLGTVHTSPYFDVYDQTIRVELTSSTLPPDASAYPVGSVLFKGDKASAALIGKTSAAVSLSEAATKNQDTFQQMVVVGKNGVNNDIEYVYTTTDAPTSGVIHFYLEYRPLLSTTSLTTL